MLELIDTIAAKLGIDTILFIICFGWMLFIGEFFTNKDFNNCIWIYLVPFCYWLVTKQKI